MLQPGKLLSSLKLPMKIVSPTAAMNEADFRAEEITRPARLFCFGTTSCAASLLGRSSHLC